MRTMAARADVAVFDATPLIFLARIGLLEESLKLFSTCLIAETVKEEVVDTGRTVGAPETAELESLIAKGRLVIERVLRTPLGIRLETNPRLSAGDRDCLVLASERTARLMADDAAVRSVANQLGLRLGGTLYILHGLIDRGTLAPAESVDALDRLVDAGWYCSARLYRVARATLERRGAR